MERKGILGVPIDILSKDDAIRHVTAFCRSQGQFHIATPNPEMLVEATKNPQFKNVLQRTSLNIPDGIGLVWAMKRGQCGATQPTRITGTDLLQRIASSESRLCPPEKIFLLGAAPGIAERAADALRVLNPSIKEIGVWSGSPSKADEEEIVRRINAFSPTLLFVAFGAPAQDLWIARNLTKLPCIKIAMGVGGAFDFLAGKRRRAPQWMQKGGIEWLWRLACEPRRIGRILNAVIVFPLLVLTEKKRHREDCSR
ncbi:MAG TPA: WecB/TagA/CpsF family glycosyltransferase [Candidatus Peribacterales bacterium]|nr:WecB/TagA/CpsF family glycosyltransferase [Candidatus Peribacterales bacterium]